MVAPVPAVLALACSLAPSTNAAPAPIPQDFGSEIGIADRLPSLTAVLVVDFDGDGRLDLVSGGFAQTGSSVFKSTAIADREFATGQSLGPSFDGLSVRDLAHGDLDGDGDFDLVCVVSEPTNNLIWFENLGSGFGPAQPLGTVLEGVLQLELRDLDGDQRLDVVWMPNAFGLRWSRNLGSGSFGPVQSFPSPDGYHVDMQIADVDGDGDQDALAVNRNSGRVNWWENMGAGNFAAGAPLVDGLVLPEQLGIGDFDGDSDLDLMVSDRFSGFSGGRLSVASNVGGSFGPPVDLSISGIQAFTFAEIDSDGLADLLVSRNQTGSFSFQRNSGGAFASAVPFGGNESVLSDVAIADVDGDGVRDVVTTVFNNTKVWYGDGTGFDSAVGAMTPLLSTNYHQAFSAGDFDEDGRADVAIADPLASGSVGAIRNLGAGSWSPPYDASIASIPLQVETIDLDDDGDLDIVFSGGSYDTVSADVQWMPNDGTGRFPSPQSLHFDLADSGALFSVGDREGDGDLDVLWTHIAGFQPFQNRFEWSEQVSPGVFAPGNALAINSLSRQFRLGDLDLDDDADVVEFGAPLAGGLQWRENTGSGGFSAPNTIAPPPGAAPLTDLRLGDLNGDGRTDIAVSGRDGVYWYSAMAAGGFGGPQSLEPATGSDTLLLLRDVNADGRLDILVSTTQQSGAGLASRWIENLGAGSFDTPSALPEDQLGSTAIGAADFDGDLDLDVLKRRRSGGLAWNENLARFGDGYCGPAAANSTGDWGAMSARGSLAIADNDVTLLAERLPAGTFGFFLVATDTSFVPAIPGSQGSLCLGGAIGRLSRGPAEIFRTSTNGDAAIALDVTNVPTPFGAVALAPGATRYVQAWYRDSNPAATSNFTNGLALSFD